MVHPLNWTTFDVIAHLAFGDSFRALETRKFHPWIESFFGMLKPGFFLMEFREMPGGLFLFDTFLRSLIVKRREKTTDFVQEKIERRMQKGVGDRPDLMAYVLRNNEEGKGISRKEILATFNIFMIGGSETTATLLSGAVYLLQKNSSVLEKVRRKIRGAFSDDKEINILKVNVHPARTEIQAFIYIFSGQDSSPIFTP